MALHQSNPIRELHDPMLPILPTELRQGDSWNALLTIASYPSSLYQLSIVFNSPSYRFLLDGSAPISAPIVADGSGSSYVLSASPAATILCQPDDYSVAAILTGIVGTAAEGEQITIPFQQVTVAPNLASATGPVDTRSFSRVRLDIIEAALRGDTRPDVQEYMINGRQIRKHDPEKLEALRQKYAAACRAEERAKGNYARPRTIGFRIKPSI